MSVAYRSTCRPTIGQSLSVDISANISVRCRSTYRPILDRYVGLYVDRHISVDISTDSWPICQSTYRPILDRYVDRCISRETVDMSADISVERCTKYTWSQKSTLRAIESVPKPPLTFLYVTYSMKTFWEGCLLHVLFPLHVNFTAVQ